MTRRDKFRSVLVAMAVLLMAVLIATPGRAQPAVAWWAFNNALNLGEDSSTSSNDLTTEGDAAYVAGGVLGGGALSLDGADDMLTGSPFPAIPTGNDDYSISAWVKTTTDGPRGIVGWGDYSANNDTNAFRLGDTDKLNNYWWGSPSLELVSPVNLLDDNWHHVATTYDGTTRTLWVDGASIGMDTPGSGENTFTPNSQPTNFSIGRTCPPCGGGEFFNGLLDDVAIFDYALNVDDITALHTGASTPGDLGGPIVVPTDFFWDVDATGSWEIDSNWSNGGPPGLHPTRHANHTVTFGNRITQPRTIVSDSAVSVRAITFDHNTTYAVAGTGNVSLVQGTSPSLPANSSIAVVQGTHEFQLPVTLENHTDVNVATGSNLTFQNALDLKGNTLTKTGNGTLSIRNDLTTSGGMLNVAEGTISGNGTVGGDLSNAGGTIAPGNSLGDGNAAQGVPEPSTVVLLCLGSVLVIAARAWLQQGRQH